MFKLEDNKKIGAYLSELIKKIYPSTRKFCRAYIEIAGGEVNDEETRKMANRLSQITKGKKAIQTYDLPIFTELLGVSCEEILTAGNHYVPISGHITNYEIAFSKDKAMWDKYINREDKLILNPDEYNKTVIDYALDFKNYEFLKYLMDNKYIWFVDNSKYDCHELAVGFCAGTSIKRRQPGYNQILDVELRYHSEERGLRQKMIVLAMENNDFDTLTLLRARENPALYQACAYVNPQTNCNDYYNENIIKEIAKSNAKVLGYFSEEFQIKDNHGYEHLFIYPYMDKLLETLIANKNKYTEAVLRRTIDHNKRVYNKLREMISEAFDLLKSQYTYGGILSIPVESVAKDTMMYYRFDVEDGFLSYMYSKARKTCPRLCSNIIYVESQSDDLLINSLIDELNNSYEAVRNIQPDN